MDAANMLEQGRKVFEIEKPIEKPLTKWLRKLQQSRKVVCIIAALYMLFLVFTQGRPLPTSLLREKVARPNPIHLYTGDDQLDHITSYDAKPATVAATTMNLPHEKDELEAGLNSERLASGSVAVVEDNADIAFKPQKDRISIIKVSAYVGNGRIATKSVTDEENYNERAIRLHRDHALKQGHGQAILRKNLVGDILRPNFNKMAILLQLTLEEMRKPEEERAEWLFWHDLDTVVLNPEIPLDIFLPPIDRTDLHLIATHDKNSLNDGVFFSRVSPHSALLFSSVLALQTTKPEETKKMGDQATLIRLLKENDIFAEAYQQIPRSWGINSYGSERFDNADLGGPETVIRPGHFLLHVPGPAKTWRSWYQDYLHIAEQHKPEYEIPLDQLALVDEIKAFWDDIPSKIIV